MAVIGLDDTDSRERGACTTRVASAVAAALRADGHTARCILVRLNPAAPHKTRGNAAVAIHTSLDPTPALERAADAVEARSVLADTDTHPGVVAAPGGPRGVGTEVAAFARRAVREIVALDDALDVIDDAGYLDRGWKRGRGRIGALAAVGARRGLRDVEWTHEHIEYRTRDRVGTPRDVDEDAVFAAADAEYPAVWDTVDRVEREAVCVPHTPGPVLYGIRGDDPAAIQGAVARLNHEPSAGAEVFVTNQGTDTHITASRVGALEDRRAYRVSGVVDSRPETRRGGHVFFDLRDGDARVQCAAFEPTKRFRDRVRALRVGDRVTVCGQHAEGTINLEKFAVRALNRTEAATPRCPGCGRGMESAGAGQGVRCRDCEHSRAGRGCRVVSRGLEVGWYEVPPRARRHVAKPLVRGGFDAPVHPES